MCDFATPPLPSSMENYSTRNSIKKPTREVLYSVLDLVGNLEKHF